MMQVMQVACMEGMEVLLCFLFAPCLSDVDVTQQQTCSHVPNL